MAPGDSLRPAVLEALRCLDDPLALEGLAPLLRLRAVEQ